MKPQLVTEIYFLPDAVSVKETAGFYVFRHRLGTGGPMTLAWGPFTSMANAKAYITRRDFRNVAATRARDKFKAKKKADQG